MQRKDVVQGKRDAKTWGYAIVNVIMITQDTLPTNTPT